MISVHEGSCCGARHELVTLLLVAQQRKRVEEVDVVVSLRQVGRDSSAFGVLFHNLRFGNDTVACRSTVSKHCLRMAGERRIVSPDYHLRTIPACDVMQSLCILQVRSGTVGVVIVADEDHDIIGLHHLLEIHFDVSDARCAPGKDKDRS